MEDLMIANNCCCEEMWSVIKEKSKVPISAEKEENDRLFYALEFVDRYSNSMHFDDDIGDESIEYCPFCAKKISVFFKFERAGRWKRRKTLCGSFLTWFEDEHKSPTRMFEYDHRSNQFYLHNRRGFGEGFTPVKYCIYCGEPLSEMIEKHGLPNIIKDCLHTDEWWKKRGL
jgi:hypothetical protein